MIHLVLCILCIGALGVQYPKAKKTSVDVPGFGVLTDDSVYFGDQSTDGKVIWAANGKPPVTIWSYDHKNDPVKRDSPALFVQAIEKAEVKENTLHVMIRALSTLVILQAPLDMPHNAKHYELYGAIDMGAIRFACSLTPDGWVRVETWDHHDKLVSIVEHSMDNAVEFIDNTPQPSARLLKQVPPRVIFKPEAKPSSASQPQSPSDDSTGKQESNKTNAAAASANQSGSNPLSSSAIYLVIVIILAALGYVIHKRGKPSQR
jgi:hypothetical protein